MEGILRSRGKAYGKLQDLGQHWVFSVAKRAVSQHTMIPYGRRASKGTPMLAVGM
jgi:hypothetical protein